MGWPWARRVELWARRSVPVRILRSLGQGGRIKHKPASELAGLSTTPMSICEAAVGDRLSFLAPHHQRFDWLKSVPHEGWNWRIEITLMGHKLDLIPALSTVAVSIPFLPHCDHCEGIRQTPANAVRCKCQQLGKKRPWRYTLTTKGNPVSPVRHDKG